MLTFNKNPIIFDQFSAYTIEEAFDIFDLCPPAFSEDKLLPFFTNKKDHQGLLSFDCFKNRTCNRFCLKQSFYNVSGSDGLFLCRFGYITAKLWLNGVMVSVSKNSFNNIYTVPLRKGINHLLIDITDFNPETSKVAVRLSDYNFEKSEEDTALLHNNPYTSRMLARPVILFEEKAVQNPDEPRQYSFMVLPRNRIDIDIRQDIKIIFFNNDDFLFDTYTNYYIKHDIDMGCFSEIENLHLKILLEHKNSKKCPQFDWIAVISDKQEKNTPMQANALFDRYQKNKHKLTALDIENIDGLIDNYPENPDLIHLIRERLDAALSGNHYDDVVYRSGTKGIYFKSKLDGHYEFCNIKLPHKYDKTKKYPLLMFLSTLRYDWFTNDFDAFENSGLEDVIIADVTQKGVLTGSYIGEACILEILEQLKSYYSIDASRIYLEGFSNGAYACFSMMQNHPGVFAGALVSMGAAYRPNLHNLSNENIIEITSKQDVLYDCKALRSKGAFKNYKLISIPNLVHSFGCEYLFNLGLYQKLFAKKLQEYPDCIRFRTERMRHNRAYWITIQKMSYGKSYAEIFAKIQDHALYIRTQNIESFTIETPPQLAGQTIELFINSKSHSIKANARQYKFTRINKEFCQETLSDKLLAKGAGILDVYLNPLNIIIPSRDHTILSNVSERFSSPQTSGFDTRVYVRYPIFTYNEIRSEVPASNLIVFDLINHASEADFVDTLRSQAKIYCDHSGFQYQGIDYKGPYCIMQILPHPHHPDCAVLYIATNKENLLIKNLFTRRLIIPSYTNGIHTYLNNMALIFYKNKYFGVYEWGMDMKEIGSVK